MPRPLRGRDELSGWRKKTIAERESRVEMQEPFQREATSGLVFSQKGTIGVPLWTLNGWLARPVFDKVHQALTYGFSIGLSRASTLSSVNLPRTR